MLSFVYELVRFWAGDRPTAARDAGLAGLLAAALLAVNAFHVHLGHQVRGYTLGILLAVLTSQMLLRALRLGSVRTWVAYACLALAFCYTHTLALCTLAAQAYFAGMYLLWNRSEEQCGGKETGPICRNGREGAAHKLALSFFGLDAPLAPDTPRRHGYDRGNHFSPIMGCSLIDT